MCVLVRSRSGDGKERYIPAKNISNQDGEKKKRYGKVRKQIKRGEKRRKKEKHGGKRLKQDASKISTFNTIGLRQLCAILHQFRRNLIPIRITRRQAEVNVCARDIVCMELYSHAQQRATSHKYIVCVLSQNKQRNRPLIAMPV